MPIEFLEIEPINPLLSKCQIKVCYVGQDPNRNSSVITKDTAKQIAVSIPGCPIVGFFNEAEGDFEEHNRNIKIANGKIKIEDPTRPYGFVPTNAKVWFQWFEDDGKPHEYLCTEGIIWTGQYPESQRVIDEGNNQSMELDEATLDGTWTKDNKGKPQFFIINEAIMSKLCILGEDVEPCFEGASFTPVTFSLEDSFKQKLYSFMEKMQEILSNEGGTPVFNTYAVEIGDALWNAIYDWLWMNRRDDDLCIHGIYEDGNQKFVILRNRKDLTYYRLNFSISDENGFVAEGSLEQVAPDFKPVDSVFAAADVEAFEAQFAADHEEKPADPEPAPEADPEPVEDPAPVEEPVVEDPAPVVEEEPVEAPAEEAVEEPVVESHEDEEAPVAYNLDEVVEYQELLTKYAALEEQVAQLNNTITERDNTITTLTVENQTLTEFKQKIDREKKSALIHDTFYMLSDDLKKDCIDNIDKYSYDEIEAKLSVICVRNKVSFDLDKPEEKKEPVTYSIDSIDDDNAGLPAWVVRVKEVEKQKNL